MKREMWWFYETLECPSLEISKQTSKYLFECSLKQEDELNPGIIQITQIGRASCRERV